MTTAIAHHTCGCGQSYTFAEWKDLPIIGYLVTEDGDYGLLQVVDMRNCACGSTRSALAPPPATPAERGLAEQALRNLERNFDLEAIECLKKWLDSHTSVP